MQCLLYGLMLYKYLLLLGGGCEKWEQWYVQTIRNTFSNTSGLLSLLC